MSRLPDSSTPDEYASERMLRQQIMERGLRDERLIAAFRATPRAHFLPPGRAASDAYSDRAVPIGHGQTISQPYIVALMTDRLEVRDDHRVLEIGTGSGYQTAVLARLAREVYSIERVKPLLDVAFERLASLGVRNVRLRHGDGSAGWPEAAPFDRILVAAGTPQLPEALLKSHLTANGVAMLPVGPAEGQMLLRVTKENDGGVVRLRTEEVCPCRFVPLLGEAGWAE